MQAKKNKRGEERVGREQFSLHVGSIRETFWLGNDCSRAFSSAKVVVLLVSRDTGKCYKHGNGNGNENLQRWCEMKRAGIEGVLANLTVPKNWTALTSSGRVWITKISLTFCTHAYIPSPIEIYTHNA